MLNINLYSLFFILTLFCFHPFVFICLLLCEYFIDIVVKKCKFHFISLFLPLLCFLIFFSHCPSLPLIFFYLENLLSAFKTILNRFFLIHWSMDYSTFDRYTNFFIKMFFYKGNIEPGNGQNFKNMLRTCTRLRFIQAFIFPFFKWETRVQC